MTRHPSPPLAVFGATSGIAREVTREWLRRGGAAVLVGRNETALRAEAADLKVRLGCECPVFVWDLLDRGNHAARFSELDRLHAPGGLLLAAGVLSPETSLETDPEATRRLFDVNLTEPVAVLNLFAQRFRERGTGFLAALSSVAGDRGRAANKTYGASKAGLTAYLEGLRASLHGSGVSVLTIKPGPVRTPMTAGYKGPSILLADPVKVARMVVDAIERRRPVTYVPGFWRWVMALIRTLPETLARKVPG
jgi:decaprenylphospho-beta-D-erythro-pentofuranosid-2-ulose 2-reductase